MGGGDGGDFCLNDEKKQTNLTDTLVTLFLQPYFLRFESMKMLMCQ